MAALLFLLLLGLPLLILWRQRSVAARQNDELAAANALRLLYTLQFGYRDRDPGQTGRTAFWTGDVSGLLAQMAPSPSVPLPPVWNAIYEADARGMAKPTPFGYLFVSMNVDPATRGFGICAYPAGGSRSRRAVLLIDARGIVLEAPGAPGPLLDFPSDAVPVPRGIKIH